MLLAAADPADPDDINNWQEYSGLLAHVGPSEIVRCRAPDVRRLAQNIVRYLYITGITVVRSRRLTKRLADGQKIPARRSRRPHHDPAEDPGSASACSV